MRNTKLLQLISSLNASEFREFKDFVYSPIFNKNKTVLRLFDALKKFYPDFEVHGLTTENIFMKVFPNEKYDYHKIKNVVSDLLGLGKKFIAFLQYRDISGAEEKFLLEQLRDRNLDSIFEQTFKVYKKNSEQSKIRDEHHVYHSLELLEEFRSYKAPKEPNRNLNFVQDELNLFLKFMLIKLLKYYNIMLHEQRQNNFRYDMKMFDEVFAYLNKNKNQDNPTLLIYYYIILLETEKDEKYFFELKKLKDKYFDELNAGDIYMLFLHMAGFCAYVFNFLGRTDFMYEHFLLSKENFDRGTITLGKILYLDFLNHVKIAVRVKEFEWAENYINKYKDLLTEEKESTLNFCYGYINYTKGNSDVALELFSKTSFPNFIIKVQVKILMLQIFYEKNFYEQALSTIDAFRHYLTREKSLAEAFKDSFHEYLRITNELIKIKSDVPSNERDYLINKITKETENIKLNQFGIKNWLAEKIKELN